MSLLMSQRPLGAPQMTHSLMMDGAAHYGSWTPGSSGNRRKFKIVLWVRRWGAFGSAQTITSAGAQDGNTTDVLQFDTSDRLDFLLYRSGVSGRLVTNAVFRDPLKWYCIEIEVDTTQATAANRLKMKVNGVEQSYSTATYPSQNFDCTFNHTYLHTLGRMDYATAQYASIYVSDFYLIDSDVPASANFYKSFPNTSIIEPRIYSGDVGLNGRRYRYRDGTSTTTLGYDDAPLFPSGGHTALNHTTLNSMATTDRLTDSPANTHAIWNALDTGSAPGIAEGGLRVQGLGSGDEARMSQAITVPTYAEFVLASAVSDGNNSIGVAEYNRAYTAWTSIAGSPAWAWVYRDDGYTINNGAGTSGFPDVASGDRVAIAVKPKGSGLYDVWFGKVASGVTTWLGSGDPAAGTGAQFTNISAPNGLALYAQFSAGTAGTTYWDACIEQGRWTGQCPTGFKAHSTASLPTPPVRKASLGFAAQLWTGNGTTQDIAMPFDISAGGLAWPKKRSASGNNVLFDTERGATNYLISDSTIAEGTDAQTLTAFTTSGITYGNETSGNANGATYVGWFWKRAAQFGFDIVAYSGNGSARTIAHGLGRSPNMMAIKGRGNVYDWFVYHSALSSPTTTRLLLSATNAAISGTPNPWNSTAPTSSVFSLADSTFPEVNQNSINFVGYLWAAIDGFSAFPNWTANANADGPFVWGGLKPIWFMTKTTAATGDWIIIDTARSPFNVSDRPLWANLSNAEGATGGGYNYDLISGGVKVRLSTLTNGSGAAPIGAMFGDPFKTAVAA